MLAPSPPLASPRIGPDEVAALIEAARRASGISISTEKHSFLELRVGRRLRETGCDDFAAYLDRLRGPGGAEEIRHLVEAVATHTTSFFRERPHYDWLEAEGLAALVEGGAGRAHSLTVWSAACSLGSEMWSAAMVLDRFGATVPGGLRWNVVGTDISRRILRRAAAAVFTEEEITGLPEELRRRHLLRSRAPGRGGTLYRIAPELRSRARLAWANLVALDPALSLTADVIFLRNVLIYFEPSDRDRAVAGVLARLRAGGILLLGHSECLADAPRGLRQIAPTIYRKD